MNELKWWQKAVFYQIYPRSFADDNGDGIGDLAGIHAKLDYLQYLGIDAIWLSPHYPSPLIDCGYDIADYCAVAPEYGSVEQFKALLDELHRRRMHLILDLVLNHTSDQHPWFLESRSRRDNPKRDWYVWQDGKKGQPPNNWYSTFGGPAWEFDPQTQSYYYHFFFKQQPDLNWHNPCVKQAMFDVVRFWLEMGVDGFRLDAIGTIYEAEGLPDFVSNYTQAEVHKLGRTAKTQEEREAAVKAWDEVFGLQHDQPGVHELMRELRAVVDEYPGRVLVGETDDLSYYGHGEDELDMVFNFPLMKTERMSADWVRANQQERAAGLPPAAWPCNTLGNHDTTRVFSRFDDGRHGSEWARLNLALMLTLRGTPFLYNGEEIGMTDTPLEDLSLFRDHLALWVYQVERDMMGYSEAEALHYAAASGRDKCRTPMQWRNAPNAGFCPEDITPWLPVHPNFAAGINVEDQRQDRDSLLNFYRTLLSVRRKTPALVEGEYLPLLEDQHDVMAFLRKMKGQICLVLLNMSSRAQKISVQKGAQRVQLIYSNLSRLSAVDSLAEIILKPFEVYIGEVE